MWCLCLNIWIPKVLRGSIQDTDKSKNVSLVEAVLFGGYGLDLDYQIVTLNQVDCSAGSQKAPLQGQSQLQWAWHILLRHWRISFMKVIDSNVKRDWPYVLGVTACAWCLLSTLTSQITPSMRNSILRAEERPGILFLLKSSYIGDWSQRIVLLEYFRSNWGKGLVTE